MASVMACLSPRDININTFRFTRRTWVHDLASQVKTGDIILFSSKHNASYITNFFTQSGWDHIAMVVKPSPTQVFLLEWGGGLFVCPLEERLMEYYESDGRLITLRQLQLPHATNRNKIEDNIEEFVDMLLRSGLGSNAAVPFKEILQAAKKQNEKEVNKDEPVIDDLEELFCSKTVAVCYKSAGLIAPSRDAGMFLPKHFAADHDKFSDLQRGASLGPEIDISFEPKSIRKFTLAMLDLTNPAKRKKKRAAELLQRAVRRFLARAELRKRRNIVGEAADVVSDVIPKRTQKEKSETLRKVSVFDKENPRPQLTTTSYAGEKM